MASRQVRDIEYELLPGSERKTTDIIIERNGQVAVRPPINYTPEEIDAVVDSKRMWIYRNLAEWRDMNATAVVREWVSGETFLYLGRSHRLVLVSENGPELQLKEGRFQLQRDLIDKGGAEVARKAFERYFVTKGQQRFANRISYFAPRVGVTVSGCKVKDMGFRWASCGRAGVLNFHWKCMMAPPKIIDYIVVHELCHLHHRNHSDSFWNEVDKVMPDWRERKEWLRRRGAGLDI